MVRGIRLIKLLLRLRKVRVGVVIKNVIIKFAFSWVGHLSIWRFWWLRHIFSSCIVGFTVRHSRDSFWFTMVHGLNSISNKKELWKELVDLCLSIVEPWCVMGYFNVVFDGHYRSNNRHVSAYEMKDFFRCIEDSHLVSPHSFGHWFSQHNNVSGEGRVTYRFDHAFVSELRLDQKENTVVQYHNHVISDHTPLLCKVAELDRGLRRPFQFLNY